MCGITGAFYAQSCKDRTDNAVPMAVELWQNQASRGTRGFGALTLLSDRHFRLFRSTGETAILIDLKLHKLVHGEEPMGILFHHRFPTSTPNLVGQTHPILVSHTSFKNDYYVVHNGVISNDAEVKKIHDAMGFTYTTLLVSDKKTEWNDSETIAIEFVRAIEKRKHKIATFGAAALAAIAVDKKTKLAHTLYLSTNGMNPLSYVYGKKSIYFASELKGTPVGENQLVKFDLINGGLTLETVQFAKREYKPYQHTHEHGRKQRRWDWDRGEFVDEDADLGYDTGKETKLLLPPVWKKTVKNGVTHWTREEKKEEEKKEEEKPSSEVTPVTDAEYEQAMEAIMGEDLEEDEQMEEIYGVLEEFVQLLLDPEMAKTLHVDFYLDQIRKVMEDMQIQAVEAHERKELADTLKIDSILTDPYADPNT